MARETKRVRLGDLGLDESPIGRHPVGAGAARWRASTTWPPGRVYIGIGAGGTGVWHLGMKTASLAASSADTRRRRQSWRRARPELPSSESVRLPGRPDERDPDRLPVTARGAAGSPAASATVATWVSACRRKVSDRVAGDPRGGRAVGRALGADSTCGSRASGSSTRSPVWPRSAAPGRRPRSQLHFARWGVDGLFVPQELQNGVVELGRATDLVTHGAVPPARSCRESFNARLAALELRVEARPPPTASEWRLRVVAPDEVEVRSARRDAGAGKPTCVIDAVLPEHRERIRSWARLDPRHSSLMLDARRSAGTGVAVTSRWHLLKRLGP